MERETGAREGLKGWLHPGKIGKFGIERLAWLLMRLTGLGLLVYFIGHIYETSHILDGKAVWDKSLEMTQTTEGHSILSVSNWNVCFSHWKWNPIDDCTNGLWYRKSRKT